MYSLKKPSNDHVSTRLRMTRTFEINSAGIMKAQRNTSKMLIKDYK